MLGLIFRTGSLIDLWKFYFPVYRSVGKSVGPFVFHDFHKERISDHLLTVGQN